MPLYSYRCGCGESFDRRQSVEDRHSATCSCGAKAEMQFSPTGQFFIAPCYRPDKAATWNEIAPIDELGHPMGRREAAKVVDVYDRDARAKAEAHTHGQEPRLKANDWKAAKREAWREHSERNRIVVGG